LRVLFTCGGTGGHINPAISIANGVKSLFPDAAVLFVGGAGNMETELVPAAGFEITTLSVDNLRRSFKPADLAHNVKSAALTALALLKAGKIIARFKPDIVVGTGGYVCFPVLKSAAAMKIPTILHESNALPGLTTKLLEKSVTRVLLGFEDAKTRLKAQEKLIVTGTPVRSEFRDAKHAVQTAKPMVLSYWGSLGAKYMNAQIPKFIRLNEEAKAFRHIHAAGKNSDLLPLETELTSLKRYIYDMPRTMAEASLVICRAGASTLNELAATSTPAILVPSPYVAENHQEFNARAVERQGAAVVLKESDASAETLFQTVVELLSDHAKLSQMSKASQALDRPAALEKILEQILTLAQSQ
jgi:UDP-N-acetylglucosamine--N-acetylmuramyl-(pentapeptide) pyrophosphoryl-undecaprenol N-acetylglucosamine transferase